MKSLLTWVSSILPNVFLPICIITRKRRKPILIILILQVIGLSSCFLHYYQPNSTSKIDAATIQDLQSADKYFILHSQHGNYSLTNIKVTNNILEGKTGALPKEHTNYLDPKHGDNNRFRVSRKNIVLYEVHFYSGISVDSNARVSIPLTDITRMDVYGLNKSATNESRVISIVGITLAVTGVIVAVVSVSNSCNCPQVYACYGNKTEFNGGLYSGAIYASLERTDYMPLQANYVSNNKMSLRIGNVEGEEQIINELKLIEITHHNGDNVLLDRHGRVVVFQKPHAPERAMIGSAEDVIDKVSERDGSYYSFTNQGSDQNTSDIILDFKKPANARTGKLVLRAKNTDWSGYLFHDFKSLFGNYYATWTKKKDAADPEEMGQWQINQTLPLLVSIKQGDHWKYIDYFATPGNTAERDMIMEINLVDFKNEDHIQIRMQTAYMFWSLDYAGMDFSEEQQSTFTVLNATRIMKSDSTSQTEQLMSKDHLYTHLKGKDILRAEFTVVPSKLQDQKTSYFLLSSGYYHFTKQLDGEPQIKKLKGFLENGAFDKYSRKEFQELVQKVNSKSSKDLAVEK